MNEIKELLDSGRQYTFDEGLSLVRKYDTNPGVISFLEQRRDMKHLGYELGRLSRFPRLIPVPGYHNAETVQLYRLNRHRHQDLSSPHPTVRMTMDMK